MGNLVSVNIDVNSSSQQTPVKSSIIGIVVHMRVALNCMSSWPLNPEHGFTFAQTLLGQSQFLAVQEYVRLTKSWCDNDAASRNFILGQSYLHSK